MPLFLPCSVGFVKYVIAIRLMVKRDVKKDVC